MNGQVAKDQNNAETIHVLHLSMNLSSRVNLNRFEITNYLTSILQRAKKIHYNPKEPKMESIGWNTAKQPTIT